MKYSKKACAALVAFLILAAPTVACSQKGNAQAVNGQAVSASQTEGGSSSSRTILVGKVTSIVGNQVTLAVGKLNRSGNGGFGRYGGSGASSGSAAESPASSTASSSSSASSSLITLTGETKTVLIPVGLTISSGRSGGFGQRGSSSGSGAGRTSGGSGSGQRSSTSGSRTSGGSGNFSGFGGGQSATGGNFSGFSGGTSSRSSGTAGGAATLTQRSSDFSTITAGMILQIVEETMSDGTQGIVSVSELSSK